jgi:hypothetical protein
MHQGDQAHLLRWALTPNPSPNWTPRITSLLGRSTDTGAGGGRRVGPSPRGGRAGARRGLKLYRLKPRRLDGGCVMRSPSPTRCPRTPPSPSERKGRSTSAGPHHGIPPPRCTRDDTLRVQRRAGTSPAPTLRRHRSKEELRPVARPQSRSQSSSSETSVRAHLLVLPPCMTMCASESTCASGSLMCMNVASSMSFNSLLRALSASSNALSIASICDMSENTIQDV